MTATAASRRQFPAWIDADERVASFSASASQPRVRDGLVLRTVGRKKTAKKKAGRKAAKKEPSHADCGR
jgi:hypothetical protein